jgi:hypothetical protein
VSFREQRDVKGESEGAEEVHDDDAVQKEANLLRIVVVDQRPVHHRNDLRTYTPIHIIESKLACQ